MLSGIIELLKCHVDRLEARNGLFEQIQLMAMSLFYCQTVNSKICNTKRRQGFKKSLEYFLFIEKLIEDNQVRGAIFFF